MHSPRPREDMPPLTIAVTEDPDDLWIHVCGEVDLSNRAQLQAALAAVDLDGAAALHLDLHQLSFSDTRGCCLLLRLERDARRSGYETRIHGATPTLRRVMTLIAPDVRDRFV